MSVEALAASGLNVIKFSKEALAAKPKASTPEAKPLASGTVNALLAKEFPPIRWIIPGILPAGLTLLAGAPKTGKALRHGEVVPTPDGWVNIESLKVGDLVYSGDGTPTKVTWTKSWVNRPCYRLHFDDGTTVDADAEHEWLTSAAKGGVGIRSTQEIVDTLRIREKGRVRANHSISLTAIKGKSASYNLAPYELGIYLGDGTRRDGYITTGDPEVFEHFSSEVTRTASTAYGYKVAGLRAAVKSVGVLYTKRIPGCYLRGSYEDRLSLFQGLMDSDGSIEVRGGCEISFASKELAFDTLELARTLGIKAKMAIGEAKLNGRVVGKRHRITFRTDLPVFRLSRKLSRQKPVGDRVKQVRIIGATPIGNFSTSCIEVEHESHLFLCGKGMIPTHNSWAVLDWCAAISSGGVVFGAIPVDPGHTLYLALEDNERRMQARIVATMRGGPVPQYMHYSHEAERIDTGLVPRLRRWLENHPGARLVVIDTLARIRPPTSGKNVNTYEADYRVGSELIRIASDFNVSIVCVHHTNKSTSSDKLQLVSGTQGLAGGFDNVFVLTRERSEHRATLYVTGRDIEDDRDIELEWDQRLVMWRMIDSPVVTQSHARRIFLAVRNAGGVIEPDRLLREINMDIGAASVILAEMKKEGILDISGTAIVLLKPE